MGGDYMISLYKDLKIAYLLTTFVAGLSLALIFGAYDFKVLGYIFILLWVLACAYIFTFIATKRFNSIIAVANNTCNIENSLNQLFGIYKGRTHKKMDLIVAIYISNLLLHYGKTNFALNILLQYNPERLFKKEREAVYKFFYYSNLVSCYNHLDKKEDALNAYKRADQIFNSPYFNVKIKSECEMMHKANYLIITDVIGNCDEILYLHKITLEKSKSLLSEVSCRFSIVNVLAACGRLSDAEEHIKFIKENGGDTLYAKCAAENNFSSDFTKVLDSMEFKVNPIKSKKFKPLIFSIIITALIVGVTITIGFFTAKTIYINNFNDSAKQVVNTFDKNGNQLVMEMQSREYFSSKEELDAQYNLYSLYLMLYDYDGCKVSLSKNDSFIDFEVIIDFKKTTDEIFEILEFKPYEQDYINANKDNEYTILKYNEFLGIRVLTGFI